jgi:hypothetical protein
LDILGILAFGGKGVWGTNIVPKYNMINIIIQNNNLTSSNDFVTPMYEATVGTRSHQKIRGEDLGC